MSDPIRYIVRQNRAGKPVALPSICSAYTDVLRATLMLTQELDRPALIEAISNQVNQFGGFTGLKPKEFVENVRAIATQVGCDPGRLTFGGDHLGPQVWNSEPADQAMAKARDLVQSCVRAGFQKIRLDCSKPCADDGPGLDDQRIAKRAASLAVACESLDHVNNLSYIVGTEVPPPGGVRARELAGHVVQPTEPQAAIATMNTHVDAFEAAGTGAVADQIVGLVVQPDVEFGPATIDHLPLDADGSTLRTALDGFPNLCFEAHSTDYQHAEAYPRFAASVFAFLKVGPALTFAYRQAMYSLDLVVDVLDGKSRKAPGLRETMETEMLDLPNYWQGHYVGDEATQEMLRHFGYSDRIRYYWPTESAKTSVASFFERLARYKLSDPMAEQFFSKSVLNRSATIANAKSQADALVLATIQEALVPYYFERNGSQE